MPGYFAVRHYTPQQYQGGMGEQQCHTVAMQRAFDNNKIGKPPTAGSLRPRSAVAQSEGQPLPPLLYTKISPSAETGFGPPRAVEVIKRCAKNQGKTLNLHTRRVYYKYKHLLAMAVTWLVGGDSRTQPTSKAKKYEVKLIFPS